ncbi:MAG TPA: Rieske (2Fe-2S) protein, partial [Methylomirabilota bacterium]|nr:Rieske (2Fe-2S) protein [Methylomirabilota bacterium]
MPDQPPQPERRDFLVKAGAAVLGAAAALPPLGVGVATLLHPLRGRAAGGSFVRVTSLSALPDDGTPRQFPVVADRQDAWNRFPQVRVGAVYLRRTGPSTVQAINVVCPHAGCFVNYSADEKHYLCPCHNSSFALDGQIKNPGSPSPRPLDTLEVEIRNGSEIWVKFQNFRAGTH